MNNETLYNMVIQKSKYGKASLAWTIKDICVTILASMYHYENLPDTIKPEFIERFLIMNGSIAGWRYDGTDEKYKDKLIVSMGSDADEPDVYGIGKNYIASTMNGYVKTLERDETGVIIYNNSSYTNDMQIINAFTDYLCEMFVSLKTNVLYTRNKPVFKASTDKERAAIIKAFEDIKSDLEPIIVTSSNVMEEIDGAPESVKVMDITDVNNADKLQYIVKTIDDTFRWFFTLYGQSVQGNGKMAQQTVKEIDGSTSLSFIYPNDRLYMRREGFKRFNELFGTDITIDYSDAWKTEAIKYKKEADIDGDNILEEPATDPDEPQPEEQPDEQPEEQPEERQEGGEE